MKGKLYSLLGLVSLLVVISIFTVAYAFSVKQSSLLANTVPYVSPLPQKGKILFVSDRNGNYEIYSMDLETKNTENLTKNDAADMNPQLSPDGRFIVFYSNRDGDDEIYRMNIKDKTITQLTQNTASDYDPEYSPDGQHVVFKSNRDDLLGDIFIMQEDGGNQRNLTLERDETEEWDPTFTPDGKVIIFVVRRGTDHLTDELFKMNVDGSDVQQITGNDFPDWYPSVNSAGKQLVFISKKTEKAADDIFSSSLTGANRRKLTDLSGNNADPAWDVTGDEIIFINDNDGDYDLYIMSSNGSWVEKIQDTPSTELSPIFFTSSR